ncbi:putative molybdenum cofactor guanylyltransferase [bacterium BMS3Abin06]|nr:putative molybdenum cofactor guanylyltransferase [bacterium BMS3Abin06]HDZ02318.1 molybdenum cofactor guanylyltransferase [Nitrospirota bacterium]
MNDLLEECSCAILAGGENTRMPVLKAFIEVEGQRLIERNLKIMKQLFSEVFIVTNRPETYSYLGVPMLGDTYNTRGPMTGIFTSLLNSSNPWVFISACDMPFVNECLIRYMASGRNNFDAIVPESPLLSKGGHRGGKKRLRRDYTEPLFAFYSKKLLLSMEKSVISANKSLRDFLSNKRVKYITSGEIRKIDPEAVSFVNLNTPEDIELYLQTKDKIKYRKKAGRRRKCLVLEQQS